MPYLKYNIFEVAHRRPLLLKNGKTRLYGWEYSSRRETVSKNKKNLTRIRPSR